MLCKFVAENDCSHSTIVNTVIHRLEEFIFTLNVIAGGNVLYETVFFYCITGNNTRFILF